MSAIVIPAKNEESRLPRLLRRLLAYSSFSPIVVVNNGSVDNTVSSISKFKSSKIELLNFHSSLGFDVPRAIGAHFAFQNGADSVIFVDGDMVGGEVFRSLLEIDTSLESGVDLALTNCYPYITKRQPLSASTLHFRQLLNKKLGLYQSIGLSSPSHGPSGISRKFMEQCCYSNLAVPPVVLSIAAQKNLVVKVATAVPHLQLGSKVRGPMHAQRIAHTIIGDCLEANCVFDAIPRSRIYKGYNYTGYHDQRRFDLLSNYLRAHT